MTAHVAAPGPARATDPERDATVERLRTAVGEGRLDLDEFDRRASRAYAAHTIAELAALTRDLVPATGHPQHTGELPIARFGTISVTPTSVHTPNGSFALRGSTWRSVDYWRERRVTPGWAVALAIVGFFVVPFVSLLFLLVKEPRTEGVLQVSVADGLRQYVVDMPVASRAHARAIEQQVGYVRTLARH
ncbi:MAG: DUF1707 domain-containing protein [Actinocatenispora sp.]